MNLILQSDIFGRKIGKVNQNIPQSTLNKSEPDSYRVEHPKRRSLLEHLKKTGNSEKSEIKMLSSSA